MVKEHGRATGSLSAPTEEASENGLDTWGAAVLADKGLFLLLLYDKAIACMEEAMDLLEAGDMVAKSDRLIRAQDIVLELSEALDQSTGEIAHNLERLYLYIYRRLIAGNVHMDRGAIAEARDLMKKLNSAWQSIIMGRDSGAVPDLRMATAPTGAEATWRMRA